ncbi:histidinol-phosphate aminotransferase [Paenibacillus marchantiophytorum]|uniref:Histidinol-phosphate aminotransferase n=1 Tax=Paenibacillus marchantiophytorum TaxID=1619310 RepID=A0ABQ1FEK6_9BACL|nr:histidinol-phosphate transaminase [Paenibacillus marchantiophytorum]GGA08209.1 histidinol-phosphate aminotransferase [Paenibacillus marchantiophytorum]
MSNRTTVNIRPRNVLSDMKPYSPGKPIWEVQRELGIEKVIKLASNENPLGPSPLALAAIQDYLSDIHRYPDADTVDLRAAIAKKYQFTSDEVLVTNGADELITLISEAFLEPGDEIVVPSPTFSEYEFGANLMGTHVVEVPLREDYSYDIQDILAAVTAKTKLLYICSPNNPTGTYMKKQDLHQLVDQLPAHVLVIFDGAYSHFVTADDYCDGLELVKAGYPIIVTQTFSKIYGLAGIRVGYGIASPSILQHIRQVKEPFNVNALAQVGAVAAILDDEHVQATRNLNALEREKLYENLQALGIHFTRSMSNFVLIDLGPEAKSIYDKLMCKGIIVRYGAGWNLPNHVRISIGSAEEQEAFLIALREVL